jgi:hypothetical protein
MRRLLSCFATIFLMLATFVLAAGLLLQPSPSWAQGGLQEKNLGGVNLNTYCAGTFGADFRSNLVGKTAGDWTCERNPNDRRPISVETACRQQYNNPTLKARALNWNDPLSWRCFAMVPAPVPPRNTFEPNTDRMGGDYTSVTLPPGSVPNNCKALCAADGARCKAWTYVKAGVQAPNPRCWLKSSIPAAKPSNCCSSGVM